MAKFIVETTVEVYSPNDWKFKVETTEKIEENFFIEFLISPEKKRLKIEERQEKGDIEEKKEKRLFRVKVEKLHEDEFSRWSHQIVSTLKDAGWWS